MCGIAGSIGPAFPSGERIERTLAAMGRRGPDGHGVSLQTVGDFRVALLHTRLAIVDVAHRADQPFESDGLTLIFNGEIYNYIEIRRELEALGQSFRTSSDTEVLLHAWRHWGEKALDRLEGMWAFALIDAPNNRLVLSRDRFGEKPLYLWRVGGTLYFGSEVKFLAALAGAKPDINQEQIRRFLVNGYKSLYKKPRTWFRDVEELPAANWATVEAPDRVVAQSYWRLTANPRAMTAAQALEGARERLDEAVRLRLRADVPIAFCLSGGIDSTTLAGIAAKRFGQQLHTFSIIDTDERYCETDNIDATVAFLGCENHRIHTSTENFFENLAELVAYHDGPVVTITYYLHSFLSKAIAERGYKVAISGNAADELFTGYYDHYAFWLAEMSGHPTHQDLLNDWRHGYGAFVQNPILKDPGVFVRNPAERGHIYLNADLFQQWLTQPFHEPFEETPYDSGLLRNRMLNEIAHETVPVILREDDLNSMFYSVENRSPYLDRRLAEFLFTVPPEHLIQNGYPKYLLRSAGVGVVADTVRLDKRKRGFNASIDSLVDRSDPHTRDRLLSDSPLFDIVRRDALESFLDGSMKDNSFSKFLFSVISVKLFLDHHSSWQP